MEAVEAEISRGQTLAFALVTVGNSADAPSFGTELADRHFKDFDLDEFKPYGPETSYLLHSHLSFKYNLTLTSDMLAAINHG
ncbi:hypothetical protein GALMADRAFT_220484 [Galerina marginata CBS 339.88]|uniref:Uncharacterized protein n=1 Tax=Galerina marginata (strain CBS 339.88) TaxID=685588 RepID=A0A067TU72_GALM3|nr:hypothetical protein GALMADRAFT_220484 [Galerina marginata CBS 339.88]